MKGNRNFSAGAVLALFSFSLAGSSTAPLHAGHLWALGNSASGGPRPLYRISPTNGTITATFDTAFRPLGYGDDVAPLGLAYGGSYLWALGYPVNNSALPLYKIDPANGALAQTMSSPFYPPGFGNTVADFINLASGGGYLWALGYPVNNGPRPLYKCNPTNGALIQTLSSPFRPPGIGNDVANKGMAYGAGCLWAFGLPVDNGQRPLYRFSPTNGALLQTILTPFRPGGSGTDIDALGLAYGAGHLWALGYSVNTGPRPLYKISPADGTIVQTLTTPFRPPGFGIGVAAVGLTFNDIDNRPPTDISLSKAGVAENQPVDTVVGILSTTDPDPADTFTYTLASGPGSADNSSFSIRVDTLRTAASFNYEARTQYSIRIRTTDQRGLSFEKSFTVRVTDLPEPPFQVTAFMSGLTGSFTLRWNCEGGYAYQVTYSETLAPGDWHNTSPAQIANNGENSMSFTDTPASGTPRRFYRIVRTAL